MLPVALAVGPTCLRHLVGFDPRRRPGLETEVLVIGSGIAGLSAAWLLRERFAVTLYEAEPRAGGHADTQSVAMDGTTIPVDTGFIVCNDRTYPNFHRFIAELGVSWRWSDMSFGYHDANTGLQYAGTTLS